MASKTGRYSPPPAGTAFIDIPRAGKRAGGKIEIVHGHDADPNRAREVSPETVGKARQVVAINCKTDPLEFERARQRISEAAYLAGRAYQRLAEQAGLLSLGGHGFEPSNRAGDRDAAMRRKVRCARERLEAAYDVQGIVGKYQAILLDYFIIDMKFLGSIAEMEGVRGSVAKAKFSAKIRGSLEVVTSEWEKRGFPWNRV